MAGGTTATSRELDEFVAFAVELATLGRSIVIGHFRGNPQVDRKADRTLVTDADREAERAMRDRIADRYPAHGVVGEEFGADGPARDYVWVVDPVDGTHAFIAGLPVFGSLIALCRDGVPVVGVIDMPALGERWVGATDRSTVYFGGTGAGRDARSRPCATLADAVLYSTSPLLFSGAAAEAFSRICERAAVTRFGTDCYGYALVASGHGDLVVETGMKPYDYLALVPVLAGAGATVTDWSGRPLTMTSGPTVVASGDGRVHRQVLAMLAAAGAGPDATPPNG